jgi:leucyl-tRNA synthetase
MGVAKGPEPMTQLRNQGQILGPDGQRMSKSRGNVIDPDKQVATYGADTVRAYLMFGYQWSEGGPWSTENIQGVVRWINRVWVIAISNPKTQIPNPKEEDARELRRATHQTIRKISDDFEKFEFNTIVSALMEMTNTLYKYRETTEGTPAWDEALNTMLLLMAPVTPHIAEELWTRRKQPYSIHQQPWPQLWTRRKQPYSIHQQPWPQYDSAIAAEELITIVVQVNGKVRDRLQVRVGTSEDQVKELALTSDGVMRILDGKQPRQVVYVPGRLVNIVV